MFLTNQNARTILVILQIVVIDFIPSAGVFTVVDNVIDCGINLPSVDSAISFLIFIRWIAIYPVDNAIQRLNNGSLQMYITQPIDATAQLLQKQTTSYILTHQLLQLQHSKHVV